MDKLLRKLERYIRYNDILSLEEDFNRVGLTIQNTTNSWAVLCKLKNGKVNAKDPLEDLIFITPLEHKNSEVSDRAIKIISDFVRNNKSKPDTVKNTKRVWNNGIQVYDKAISIFNEDVCRIAQLLID